MEVFLLKYNWLNPDHSLWLQWSLNAPITYLLFDLVHSRPNVRETEERLVVLYESSKRKGLSTLQINILIF